MQNPENLKNISRNIFDELTSQVISHNIATHLDDGKFLCFFHYRTSANVSPYLLQTNTIVFNDTNFTMQENLHS